VTSSGEVRKRMIAQTRFRLFARGTVTAPDAVLIRPDGYVAWVGDLTQLGLADALTSWFGTPYCGVAQGF
jgi:aromatic ring hydroxylase-like protein